MRATLLYNLDCFLGDTLLAVFHLLAAHVPVVDEASQLDGLGCRICRMTRKEEVVPGLDAPRYHISVSKQVSFTQIGTHQSA